MALNIVTFRLFGGDRKEENSFKELTGQSRYKPGTIKSRQAAKDHLAECGQLTQQPFVQTWALKSGQGYF